MIMKYNVGFECFVDFFVNTENQYESATSCSFFQIADFAPNIGALSLNYHIPAR